MTKIAKALKVWSSACDNFAAHCSTGVLHVLGRNVFRSFVRLSAFSASMTPAVSTLHSSVLIVVWFFFSCALWPRVS